MGQLIYLVIAAFIVTSVVLLTLKVWSPKGRDKIANKFGYMRKKKYRDRVDSNKQDRYGR